MASRRPLASAGSGRGGRRRPVYLEARPAAAGRGSRLTILLILTAFLADCGVADRAKTSLALTPAASTAPRADRPPLGAAVDVPAPPTTVAPLAVPAELTTGGLGVAVDVPAPPTTVATLAVPAALTAGDLSLRAGPVAVPLELDIPSLGVDAPVVGVGMTSAKVMDAPMGPANDPVWQEAFWYRGSAIPGALSTAVFAGHVSA
ncbi:MAG: hypothetical protein ABJD24_10475, partial [Acidimicrobiales bacterium]